MHARIQGGAKGALAPPSPQNIAPPNSEARANKRALPPPPYKILDPPMLCTRESLAIMSARVTVDTAWP